MLPIALLSSVGFEVCALVALEAVLSELCSFELDLPLLEEVLDERDDSDRGAVSFGRCEGGADDSSFALV